MIRTSILACLVAALGGCAFGPRTLQQTHGRYNEAFNRVASEELLLNIVRLRYGDPPAEVEVSGIANQFELSTQAEARPFFSTEADGGVFRAFSTVLPFIHGELATRPTISLTPIQTEEAVGRLLRPISPEGVAFLAETSWPISTIFRLWLESFNEVPNAPSASGPARDFPPEFVAFRRATELLQYFQDRNALAFRKIEVEVPGDPIALDKVDGDAILKARTAGYEYRLTPDKSAWRLIGKSQRLYVQLNAAVVGTPEYGELTSLLNLKPGSTSYEVTGCGSGPPSAACLSMPSEKGVVVTRSLIQVLFYLSHGVEAPTEHLASGIIQPTFAPDGRLFDWGQLTGDLFTVKSCRGKKPPPCAAVAVQYRGYWFYIDDADQATKSTFSLVRGARHIDVGAPRAERKDARPVLTLPAGR